MNSVELLAFLRCCRWAVETSVSPAGRPQAAVIGFAATDSSHLIFDTIASSRKAGNLRTNPHIALVIGGLDGREQTVQYEGVVDFPVGQELDDLKRIYFDRFPDGRDRAEWSTILYVRVTPRWVRYSDFSKNPPVIVEFPAEDWRS